MTFATLNIEQQARRSFLLSARTSID